MEQSIRKFLEFNGQAICFLAKRGDYWVAIRPICDALGITFDRQLRTIKDHPILGQLWAKQPMTGADGKTYQMASLPERYVYGWLFQIRSGKKGLIEYQRQCFDILFDYFHGSITSRETLIKAKTKDQVEAERLEIALSTNTDYQELQMVRGRIRAANSQLRDLDKSIAKDQLELFNNPVL